MTMRKLDASAALAGAWLCLSLGGTAAAVDQIPEIGADAPAGYLKAAELPDSLKLLPRPPALGSAAEALDQDVARETLTLQGTARFKLAALDADLGFPNAAGTFSCALGIAVTKDDTPVLYRLLRRAASDAGAATYAAKDKYLHARPFMLDGAPTCQPDKEKGLRSSGSYPSGHATAGWTWALTLAEAAPDRAEAVLERGRAFGESRLVCNVHWASDVMEARVLAAATVARLHADADYRADVAEARKEIDAARAKGSSPQRDCAFESEAMQQTPWFAP